MKTLISRRYLSGRITILASALFLLALVLVCAVAALGAKPWIVAAFAIALIALLIGAYFGVVQPYMRWERVVRLFLDGYTIMGPDGAVELTPESERLVKRVKDEFNSSYLLKLSKRQAQFRALQNQINPHFLYNTLESIRSEALVAKLDSVADMTEALAVFFRYTISKLENLVTVEEELQNCETYFRIQQYRFGNRLQLSIECPDEDRDEIYRCRIPKLTLQPIMENSIIHGTEYKIGAGKLSIKLERSQSNLHIDVSDDGIGMDEIVLARLNERLGKSGREVQDEQESNSGGVALVNVNNRIHLLFGEQYGLHVYSMPDMGTDVRIMLPAITSDRGIIDREVLQ